MLDFNSLLETALWATTDFDGNNLDDSMYADYEPSEDFEAKCKSIMDEFIKKAGYLFTPEELENNPIEHDLWLTMHGHGAGFWDGDYEKGEEITAICKELGELEDDLREDMAGLIK